MQLILMRHGEAEPNFRNDSQRNLTTRGFMECQKTGVWLRQNIGDIDVALVSPYVRARQSFETIKSIVSIERFEESSDIIPSGDPKLVQDYVHALCDDSDLSSLLIVSHMPLVSYLVDSFCGSFKSHLFSTASVTTLNYKVSENKAEIAEIYTPEP